MRESGFENRRRRPKQTFKARDWKTIAPYYSLLWRKKQRCPFVAKNTLKLLRISLKAFSKTPDFLRPGSGTSCQPVALAPSELGAETDAVHHREEMQRFEPMTVRRKWFLIQSLRSPRCLTLDFLRTVLWPKLQAYFGFIRGAFRLSCWALWYLGNRALPFLLSLNQRLSTCSSSCTSMLLSCFVQIQL